MLVLKEVEGFSVKEIGEIMGLNVNTVKVRLFRARARLVELRRHSQGNRMEAGAGRSGAGQREKRGQWS
jgi:DNA-directed RNA polymerase specialized sigma24 family protein